jgi:hypothetical protein
MNIHHPARRLLTGSAATLLAGAAAMTASRAATPEATGDDAELIRLCHAFIAADAAVNRCEIVSSVRLSPNLGGSPQPIRHRKCRWHCTPILIALTSGYHSRHCSACHNPNKSRRPGHPALPDAGANSV